MEAIYYKPHSLNFNINLILISLFPFIANAYISLFFCNFRLNPLL